MALTLTEAAKLSNDVVQQGVIETVVKESPVLSLLPLSSSSSPPPQAARPSRRATALAAASPRVRMRTVVIGSLSPEACCCP